MRKNCAVAGLGVAGLALAALTACGSSSSVETADPDAPGVVSTPTPAVASPTSTPVDSSTVVSTSYTFVDKDSGGVTVNGEIRLSGVMSATSPDVQATWQAIMPSATSAPSCLDNSSRDGIVVGELTLTNTTPNYTPGGGYDGFIRFAPSTNAGNGTNTIYEADYGNGPQCEGGPTGEGSYLEVDPQWDATTFEVPIAIIIPNLYGPNGIDQAAYTAASDQAIWWDTANTGTLTPGYNMAQPNGPKHEVTFVLPPAE